MSLATSLIGDVEVGDEPENNAPSFRIPSRTKPNKKT